MKLLPSKPRMWILFEIWYYIYDDKNEVFTRRKLIIIIIIQNHFIILKICCIIEVWRRTISLDHPELIPKIIFPSFLIKDSFEYDIKVSKNFHKNTDTRYRRMKKHIDVFLHSTTCFAISMQDTYLIPFLFFFSFFPSFLFFTAWIPCISNFEQRRKRIRARDEILSA